MEDLDEVEQQELEQNVIETAIPLTREDGKTDRWAPSSLYLQEPLHSRANLGPKLCVKLSDFGAAFFMSNPPKRTATPLGLRAPELILNQPFDSGIDIWAFGCLVYEFLTGQALFVVMMFGYDQEDRETTDDTHLTQLNDKIRRLPKSIMDDWPRAGKWFDSDYNPLRPYGYYDSY
ncbi:hypothetical protein N0V94_001002 [Neodidymelliopsis sp. IMI 364377]|nr:hypothetical protein N0V94_001002 [Neodidymelliopsis sp. IMI 364377]